MDRVQLANLYDLLPPGIFQNPSELQAIIEREGVGVFYQSMPEGAFGTLEDFERAFDKLKKKDISALSGGESSSGMGMPEVSLDYAVTDPKAKRYGADVTAPEKDTR